MSMCIHKYREWYYSVCDCIVGIFALNYKVVMPIQLTMGRVNIFDKFFHNTIYAYLLVQVHTWYIHWYVINSPVSFFLYISTSVDSLNMMLVLSYFNNAVSQNLILQEFLNISYTIIVNHATIICEHTYTIRYIGDL